MHQAVREKHRKNMEKHKVQDFIDTDAVKVEPVAPVKPVAKTRADPPDIQVEPMMLCCGISVGFDLLRSSSIQKVFQNPPWIPDLWFLDDSWGPKAQSTANVRLTGNVKGLKHQKLWYWSAGAEVRTAPGKLERSRESA